MVPIFNISSSGGSATLWLTNLLNRHAGVVCMHALRDNPFTDEPIGPAQMVKGLLDLTYRVRGSHSFGVVHSFYGSEIYDEIRAVGGGFMAIVRHPVARIHSLFSHHYRDIGGHQIRNGDVYGTMSEDGTSSELLPVFDSRVKETLRADMQNLTTAQPGEVAVFERMTSDADYCRERLEMLLDTDLSALMPAIRGELGNKLNQHVDARRAVDDIFGQWPRPFRDCFQGYATHIGLVGVRDVYRHYGYDVAPMLVG